MFRNDKLDFICDTLLVFVKEVNEQAAAIRAYCNVFSDQECNNVYINRANDAIWRELVSDLARIFDNSRTLSDENCTLSRLKEVCLEAGDVFLDGNEDKLLLEIDRICDDYKNMPIKKARNKQLSHHDIKQLSKPDGIEISLDEVEKLISDTTSFFEKIYSRVNYGWIDLSFPDYATLVKSFENALHKVIIS